MALTPEPLSLRQNRDEQKQRQEREERQVERGTTRTARPISLSPRDLLCLRAVRGKGGLRG